MTRDRVEMPIFSNGLCVKPVFFTVMCMRKWNLIDFRSSMALFFPPIFILLIIDHHTNARFREMKIKFTTSMQLQ